jgi:hypothetical protein
MVNNVKKKTWVLWINYPTWQKSLWWGTMHTTQEWFTHG